jgi:hypothetical protein
MSRFAELLAVFTNAATHTSITISGKRRALVIEALQIAVQKEAMMTETTTPAVGVPVVLSIPHQRIADIITTALETPAGGWLIKALPPCHLREHANKVRRSGPWYSFGATYELPDFQMIVTVSNPVNDGKGDTIEKCLTREDFQNALILMSKPDYAHHFADFLGENDDANTADLFMQLAVYGEEVFA